MHRATCFLLLMAAAVPSCFARAASPSQSRSRAKTDRLGMTCAEILQMSSSDWIAKFASANASSQDAQFRAIRVYGECYDERTNHLAATLGRSGKGPLMGARGDFDDFDRALKDFTTKALTATDPPANALKSAYAGLYEKQFRYAFYQGYEQNIPPHVSRSSSPPGRTQDSANDAEPSIPSAGSQSSVPADGKVAANSNDPLSRAKNRFGELLGALPEDQIHEVHAAFENVMVARPVDSATELAVYRYAIFVLEPPPARANSAVAHHGPPNPFSPPAF